MTAYPINPVFEGTPEEDSEGRLLHVVGAQDWLGGTFRVGDRVMYCIGAGQGQMMAIGVVQKMRAKMVQRTQWDPSSMSWVQNVSIWEIEVQVITEKTSSGWNNEKRTRAAWVNPMNITALPAVDTSAGVV